MNCDSIRQAAQGEKEVKADDKQDKRWRNEAMKCYAMTSERINFQSR